MSAIIHARLDEKTEALRRRLGRRLGWSDSKIVREGIKVLSNLVLSVGKSKIVGLGKFSSGIPDLGSNKKHLDGFGK